MAITLTQLRAFHALAITKSFTLAAERLFVSQPAITAQIKLLEEDYGVALFNREGHAMRLSDTGELLFDVSHRILQQFDEAEEVLTSELELRSGTLRLGSDSPFLIMEVLAEFKRCHPEMTLKVDMGSASSVFKSLNRYDVDVAVVTVQELPSEFFAEPFSRLSLMLLLPLDHKWIGRSSIKLRVTTLKADFCTLRRHMENMLSVARSLPFAGALALSARP